MYYAGAWRSENETWAFLRNACDCPGPAAAVAKASPSSLSPTVPTLSLLPLGGGGGECTGVRVAMLLPQDAGDIFSFAVPVRLS